MKVLQINCVYAKGSTGKIVLDINQVLKKENIDSHVCYGRGLKVLETNVYKTSSEILAKTNNIISRLTGTPYSGAWIATYRLIKSIERIAPDIVHLHCINGYFVNIYSLLNYLKKNKIKTILTLHAEFMYTGNCGYAFECDKWMTGCGKCHKLKEATSSVIFDRTNHSWKKMKKSFKGFNDITIVSVSPWLHARAKVSPILRDKNHEVVLNGIDTKNIFYPKDSSYLKERYNIKDEKVLIHVTANFTSVNKGGKFIIALAERLAHKKIKIMVIGNKDKDLELPANIIDVGCIYDQYELAAYYSFGDLSIITSKCETFSMVCAESLACGTPIVGFKAGAPELISLSDYSEFVEYGNLDLLEKCVMKWLSLDLNKGDIANIAREYYSKEKMCNEYIEIYNRLIMEDKIE